MAGETDNKDRREARRLAIVLVSLVVVLAVGIVLMLTALSETAAIHLSPGLGLKDSAIVSFIVTILVMVIFSVAAGDGFLGEVQFILAAFFLFFVIIWLLIAWIF